MPPTPSPLLHPSVLRASTTTSSFLSTVARTLRFNYSYTVARWRAAFEIGREEYMMENSEIGEIEREGGDSVSSDSRTYYSDLQSNSESGYDFQTFDPNLSLTPIPLGPRPTTTNSNSDDLDIFRHPFLFGRGPMMRGVHGTLNPSLWKYYHRHGYWATRRKSVDFGRLSKYRYHEVPFLGKQAGRYQAAFNKTIHDRGGFYRPSKNWAKF